MANAERREPQSEAERAQAAGRFLRADGVLAPEERARAYEAVSDALPPTPAGRDLLLDVLRLAAAGPDDPGLYLRAMHAALDPVAGPAASPTQLAVACDEWIAKRRGPGVHGFVGFVQRAYAKATPTRPAAQPEDAMGVIPAGRDGAARRTFRNALAAIGSDALDPAAEVFPAGSPPPRLTRGAA